MENGKPFLTVPEVAAILGISVVRTYQMIADGTLPGVKLSPKRVRVPRAAFLAWIEAQSERALAGVAAASALASTTGATVAKGK